MSTWELRLLYDGECPLCRCEAEWLKRRDTRGRLALEDISALGFDPQRYGLRADEVQAAIHGVLRDGRVVRGMDAVREAYRVVGLGWIAAPTRWPVVRWWADRLYRLFARNRVRIGRILGRDCDGGVCRKEG